MVGKSIAQMISSYEKCNGYLIHDIIAWKLQRRVYIGFKCVRRDTDYAPENIKYPKIHKALACLFQMLQ